MFELERYSADHDVVVWLDKIPSCYQLLTLLRVFKHFISHNFVDKRQNNRNFLTICLSFCSMKCVIKVIPPHSNESPSVRWKAGWIAPNQTDFFFLNSVFLSYRMSQSYSNIVPKFPTQCKCTGPLFRKSRFFLTSPKGLQLSLLIQFSYFLSNNCYGL